jgi:hypothetical protein
MKIYIQRVSDRFYYAGKNEWCKDRASAFTYPTTFAALEDIIAVERRSEIEIILAFDDAKPMYDIHLPGPKPLPSPQTDS